MILVLNMGGGKEVLKTVGVCCYTPENIPMPLLILFPQLEKKAGIMVIADSIQI